jgi:hypothetical protein
LAQAQLVDETSAQATAVGYLADSTKADKAKHIWKRLRSRRSRSR